MCTAKNKRYEMKRLLQRDDFTAVFDALLDIPGLWPDGMRLGVTKDMMGLKCDEVGHLLHTSRAYWPSSGRRCSTISTILGYSGRACFDTTSAVCRRWIASPWRRWNSKHRADRHPTPCSKWKVWQGWNSLLRFQSLKVTLQGGHRGCKTAKS